MEESAPVVCSCGETGPSCVCGEEGDRRADVPGRDAASQFHR